MNLIYHELFITEAVTLINYYEEKSPGLGKAIDEEMEVRLTLLDGMPSFGPRWHDKRRLGLKSVPAGIIYKVFDENLYIMGLKPDAMEDEPWVKRI